jgi:putative membrane protein
VKNTGTILGVILVVVLVVLLLGGAGMMGFGFGAGGMMGGYGGYGGMMGGYGGYGFNPIGAILSLVFWALIIGGIVLLVVWLARNAGRTTFGASAGNAPLDILKARYAKGEITKEQFDAIKRDLGA